MCSSTERRAWKHEQGSNQLRSGEPGLLQLEVAMMIATCVPLSCGLRGRLRAYYNVSYEVYDTVH
jgi:hypothetical protein